MQLHLNKLNDVLELALQELRRSGSIGIVLTYLSSTTKLVTNDRIVIENSCVYLRIMWIHNILVVF